MSNQTLRLPPNKSVWAGTSIGKIMVRRAYILLMEEVWSVSGGQSSDSSAIRQVWNSIWSMKTPNKIRNFAWRAWRDILATKVNLKKRPVTNDDLCNDCGNEAETSYHMFWFCNKVKEVWSNSKLVFPFQIDSKWIFIDVIWQIAKYSPKSSSLVEKTLTFCWEIWKSRNTVRHGGTRRPRKVIVRNSLSLVEAYRAANEVDRPNNPTEVVKWHPPKPPRFKMSVDGAVFTELGATGMGLVMRDSEGKSDGSYKQGDPSTPDSARS